MNDVWIVSKATVTGYNHVADNIPCQDAHKFKYFEQEGFSIAVISDGSGSACFSHLGAGLIVENAMELFYTEVKTANFHINPPTISGWEILSRKVFESIYNILSEYAIKENMDLKSLAATVIVLIVTQFGLLVTHIGDGRAGFLNESGEWKSCMEPYKGEYANETVFLTSVFDESFTNRHYIKSHVISENINAFTLLTDGCENVCFELRIYDSNTQQYIRENKPFKNFFDHNCKSLLSLAGAGLSEDDIDELWKIFLERGMEQFVTEPDDRTMILGVKRNTIFNDNRIE
ncbi:MAG TPA: PP2C family serine/threonine-protein phosphatase [Chitinophagaceae bacterium]|nr:PP2C family serine/threonine-protein phosphatase [Chitinophagaceae bacterium]